jgi:hypothetical protein
MALMSRNNHIVWHIAVITFTLVATLSGCSEKDNNAPDVLGIPFAQPISAIKEYVPEGTNPERYPFIHMYGYRFKLLSPESWTVIVQDDGGGSMTDKRIFSIYFSKRLEHECKKEDVQNIASQIERSYSKKFGQSLIHYSIEQAVHTYMAVSNRCGLVVACRCSNDSVNANFCYLDLDRFNYTNPDEIKAEIKELKKLIADYKSHTFK